MRLQLKHLTSKKHQKYFPSKKVLVNGEYQKRNIILPSVKLQLKLNQEIQVKKTYINKIDIPDEFDTYYMTQQLIKHRRVFVLGSLPGF